MTNLDIGIISAITGGLAGAISAFILDLIKQTSLSRRRKKSALVEAEYILMKYLSYLRMVQKWHFRNRHLNVEQTFDVTPVGFNINDLFSQRLTRALRYQIYFADNLQIELNTLNLIFLTNKNKSLLDALLLSKHQYSKSFKFNNDRNALLIKLKELIESSNTQDEVRHHARGIEDHLFSITRELLKTLWNAREDTKKAIKKIQRELNCSCECKI